MELTQEIVRELLDYDQISGKLSWKKREAKWFKNDKQSAEMSCKTWNTRFAYKEISKKDKDGYLVGGILGKKFRTHRIIWLWMTGEWPDQIDHKNGIKNDNRWENLSNVCCIKNSKNISRKRNNKSGKMGVFWREDLNKWQVSITVNKVSKYLGCFECFEVACLVRSENEAFYGFSTLHGRDFIDYSL